MIDLGKATPRRAQVFEPCGGQRLPLSSKRIHLSVDISGKGSGPRNSSPSPAMIYYSLDPQFATLLFSVYSRNERLGFSVFPDAFCSTVSSSSSSSILSYAHTVGLQLIALGEQYTSILSQVRAGSVIFLVGVGSLVCWKIWDYWNSSGGGIDPPNSPAQKPPSPRGTAKTPDKSGKTFFTTLLEEEVLYDFEDLEDDDDPALIQQLINLGRIYIKKIIVGKYFGPESPVEAKCKPIRKSRANHERSKYHLLTPSPPLTSDQLAKNLSEAERQYLADNSASCSSEEDGGCIASEVEEDSLPPDGILHSINKTTRKVKRRRHHRSERIYQQPRSPRISYSKTAFENQVESKEEFFLSKRFHPYDRNANAVDDFSSSETSPIGRPSRQDMARLLRQSRLSSFQRRREATDGGNQTPAEAMEKSREMNSSTTPPFVNYNSDEDWTESSRQQPDAEEDLGKMASKRSLKDVPLFDLMGRLRQKGSQLSLSRENSVSSRLSGFLRRDDSVCSNLSEFCNSECSELSLDLSIKDDSITNQTITSFADIEDELNTLKSSVIEMDEEFLKFASKPNPYVLKTTFSDFSLESSDSRPQSSLDVSHATGRPQAIVSEEFMDVSSLSVMERITSKSKRAKGKDGISESKGVFAPIVLGSGENGEDNQLKNEMLARRNSMETTRKLFTQDELMSLEWDNSGCLRQYDEEDSSLDDNELERMKFLPDHSSLELDLERELQSPSDSLPKLSGRDIFTSSLTSSAGLYSFTPGTEPGDITTKDFVSLADDSENRSMKPILCENQTSTTLPMEKGSEKTYNAMSTSVDSAIGLHSASGSRSGSSSPVSQLLTQSMMSSGIGTSWTDISSTAANSGESTNTCKLRKFGGTTDSGYVESGTGLESSMTNLSPVHEIREKEVSSDHSTSSPRVFESSLDNCQGLLTNEENEIELNGNIFYDNNKRNNNIMGNASSLQETDSPLLYIRPEQNNPIKAIGDKQDILSYASVEWQGNSITAQTIRKGYRAIPDELNLRNLRRIRGDNYCGIRAALYQILSSSLPLPNGYQIFNRLVSEVNKGASWIKDYSFGRRLTYPKDQVINGFKECLEALDQLCLDLTGCENKENVLLASVNGDSRLDVQLCEAIKLHMLSCALDLYKQEVEGRHIPLFGMIMFARQSCLNPKEFLINHLNPVGDTAGLEQIEMFLLGHALRVTLQVVRPSSFGGEDFICFYPDENIGIWPEVNLIAEDDRHYNVLVK